ncbi:hypothetical protein CWT12_02375 [Actinomyces sp. 432]|uniref:hypothetical protein n=1 Tax=Actinomyces sp. 432 TaxID=2057798 RepID=UPI0013746D88|nr:hypothetical protein [Actinomyces sp. 432]QHO90414.1 hypothetical protein CWT12_02375 [Actinomyces sp. 432]
MANHPSPGSPYAHAPQGAGPTNPFGPAAPAAKGRKGPLILLLSGVLLIVAAVVLIVVFTGMAARTVGGLQPISANGSTAVQLEPTAVYGLYGNGDSQCTVTAADGTEAEVSGPSSNVTVNERRLFGVVEAGVSGDYTVTCTTDVPGEDVYFGELIDAQAIMHSVFSIFLVVGLLVVGLPLTIAGVIWLVARSAHNKRALQAQSSAPFSGRPGF